jgi:hypothetical protein
MPQQLKNYPKWWHPSKPLYTSTRFVTGGFLMPPTGTLGEKKPTAFNLLPISRHVLQKIRQRSTFYGQFYIQLLAKREKKAIRPRTCVPIGG